MTDNNAKINAIALDLVRALVQNVYAQAKETDTNVKLLALGAREPVVAALSRSGPEPLVAALAHHVASLAILYEPGAPSRALDRLEKFLEFSDAGDYSQEAIDAAMSVEGAAPLDDLRKRIDDLADEIPALRAQVKAAEARAEAAEARADAMERGDAND